LSEARKNLPSPTLLNCILKSQLYTINGLLKYNYRSNPNHMPHLDSLGRRKAGIIDFLPTKDVINPRLTSKDWEGICVRGLFNAVQLDYDEEPIETITSEVFSTQQQPDDMRRLWRASQRSWMARNIKHVEIYVGDFCWKPFFNSLYILTTAANEDFAISHLDYVHELMGKFDEDFPHCDLRFGICKPVDYRCSKACRHSQIAS
jgi:hypothetical protein